MEKYTAQQQQLEQEETIDLLEVFHVLWSKAWILILSLVAGAVILALVTVLFVTPQYEATSTIYILSRTTSITSLADLQIGSSLAADFQIIATTREVVESVLSQYQLDMTYEQFVDTVEVTNPTDSHMLCITVTNPDQHLVAQLSNALADELKARIADVMNTDTPSTVERAIMPENPSSPNLMINTALGGIAAMVLAAGIILVQHFLDDSIKDEQDVQRYLHLNTLAAIPLERTNQKKQRPARQEEPADYPDDEEYDEDEEIDTADYGSEDARR